MPTLDISAIRNTIWYVQNSEAWIGDTVVYMYTWVFLCSSKIIKNEFTAWQSYTFAKNAISAQSLKAVT